MKQLVIFNEMNQATVYGIGTYIREVVDCLHQDFKIIVVIYLSKEKEFIVKQERHHLEIHIPPYQLQYIDGKADPRYFVNSIFLIHNYVNQDEGVIFHFNTFLNNITLIDLLHKYFPSAKMVFTVHYFYWCFLIDGNTDYFREIISKPVNKITTTKEKEIFDIFQNEKTFLNRMDVIFCLADYSRSILKNEYQIPISKISLLHNGLRDEGKLLSFDEKEIEKRKLHLPPNAKIILFVGRLDKIKGLDYLIRSFQRLYQKRKDCYLIIVGNGEFDNFISECEGCRLNIVFTGKLSKEQVYRYYRIADVGVMLSKHEQCSYVAIEMMMHGLPIIASDSTGLDEMVTNGINGYKIQTINNKENVSFDIDTCYDFLSLSLSEINDNMRLNCRSQYEKRYNIEKMKEGIHAILDSL